MLDFSLLTETSGCWVIGTKCHATSFLNNLNVSEVQNCVKCVELEIQLQQVLKELSSVQQIIQMLKKERVQEDTAATSIYQMETELEVDDSWKRMTIRGSKRRRKLKLNYGEMN